MKQSVDLETVFVEHDAREALTRMNNEGLNHLCVIDGDLVIGVLSRERLRENLKKDKNEALHNIMEQEVLVINASYGRKIAQKALSFHNAPFALLIDGSNQVLELIECDPSSDSSADKDVKTYPGRFVELSAEQQSGATGNPDKVYSIRPHIEKDHSA